MPYFPYCKKVEKALYIPSVMPYFSYCKKGRESALIPSVAPYFPYCTTGRRKRSTYLVCALLSLLYDKAEKALYIPSVAPDSC